MADAKLKNSLTAVLVPAADADALLRAGDGDAALLYLYLLRTGGVLDTARAARELGRSDRDMTMAADRLRALGLLAGADAEALPPPAGDPPEYNAADIVRRSTEDPQFRALVREVELSLGRTLSRPDLNKLLSIYNDLALPADVTLLLVNFCKDESLRRYGPGRAVGMTFIFRVAQEWCDQEILTYEMAERWLRAREERRTVYGQLRGDLGITDRDLSKTERAYVDAWLDLGFPPEALTLAAERTIARTGGMKWKYADAILQAWHEKNLHTPAEIEAKDGKPPKKEREPLPEAARDDSEALAQIRRLREKLNSIG